MKINQDKEDEKVVLLVVVQNLGARRIILRSYSMIGSRRENVMWTIKLICWCRMFLITTILKTLKYLVKLYSPLIVTACNFKNHCHWYRSTSIIICMCNSIITRPRPIDFTFFEVFSIWNVPFAPVRMNLRLNTRQQDSIYKNILLFPFKK